MILIIDVDYREDESAVAAGLTFDSWVEDVIIEKHVVKVDNVAPYEPGIFYKRELPCLLELVHSLAKMPEIIVIDGYVTLGNDEKDGLGAHLYNALNSNIPVIGVAKNRFTGTPSKCEVYRGQSKQPLFVTCKGVDINDAKEFVQKMHGEHRLPTLIKAVDRECRGAST